MDAAYLKENIGEELSNGLAQVVLQRPEDPVDFLGRWLLKKVADSEQTAKDLLKQKDYDEIEKQIDLEDKEKETLEQARLARIREIQEQDIDFETFMESCADSDELLQKWTSYVQARTHSTAVYIADYDKTLQDELPPAEPEDGESDSENEKEPEKTEEVLPGTLKYRSVAPMDTHAFMLDEQLQRPLGIAHDLFLESGESEEADDGEKKHEERKLLYVPNTLLSSPLAERVYYFRGVPKAGSFLTMAASFQSLLHEEALSLELPKSMQPQPEQVSDPEADVEKASGEEPDKSGDAETEKPEEEPEEKLDEEPEEPLPTKHCDLVIGMDTLGQSNRFSQDMVAKIKKWTDLLEIALGRIDKATFLVEHKNRRTFLDEQSKAAESAAEKEGESEELLKALKEELGEIPDDELKFKHSQKIVLSYRALIHEFSTYHVFKGNLRILQALFYMLDFEKNQIADSKNKPIWKKMRMHFNSDLFEKLEKYDPSLEQKRSAKDSYAKVKHLKRLLKGQEYEQVKESNFALAQLLNFANDALATKIAAKQRRIDEKKKADDATKAEAEESAKAEAEEAGEKDTAEVEEPKE